MIAHGRRSKTRIPAEAPEPRKELKLKKTTVRDLETGGRAGRVKGGATSTAYTPTTTARC